MFSLNFTLYTGVETQNLAKQRVNEFNLEVKWRAMIQQQFMSIGGNQAERREYMRRS